METTKKEVDIKDMSARQLVEFMESDESKDYVPKFSLEGFRKTVPYIKFEIPGIRVIPFRFRSMINKALISFFGFLSIHFPQKIANYFLLLSEKLSNKSEFVSSVCSPIIWGGKGFGDFIYNNILLNTADIAFSISESTESLFAIPHDD